jgi:molybdopterin synthase sulfur carrier subunit
MIRVMLPAHLRLLAKSGSEVEVEVDAPVTLGAVLNAVEAKYPTLGGTIRDYGTLKRRPFVRYFVCGEDWSHEPAGKALPEEVVSGKEPLMIVGAIAGGRG